MRRGLFVSSNEPPPRPALTRSHKSARLPSVDDLTEVHLKTTHQKHHCLPPSDLHDYIGRVHLKGVVRERQWNAIQLRCQTHPEEASRLDRRGRTCLHAACAKKPPLAAIHALVKACNNTFLLDYDNHGRSPLHIAISSNASLDVIEFLLESEMRAASMQDHLGRLPLHLACIGYDHGQVELVRMLIPENPSACSYQSHNGRVPLHLAIEGGAPVQVIDLLVQACPEAVEMNGCGMNSLFVAIQQNASLHTIKALVRARPQVTSRRDSGGAFPLRRAMEKHAPTALLECLCTSPEIVMDVDDHMNNTALHTAFECGIPQKSMVRLLVTIAPQVSILKCRSGHTPLTLACQKYVRLVERGYSHSQSMWNSVSILLRAAKYGNEDLPSLLQTEDFVVHAAVSTLLPKKVVMTALTLNPEQALFPDFNRSYPLLLALTGPYEESKRDVVLQVLQQYPEAASVVSSDGRSMLSIAATARSIHPDVITELLNANPDALRQLDPHVSLYPFQLAALEKDEAGSASDLHPRIRKEWENKVDQDILQVSVIFRLMVAAPDLVGVRN